MGSQEFDILQQFIIAAVLAVWDEVDAAMPFRLYREHVPFVLVRPSSGHPSYHLQQEQVPPDQLAYDTFTFLQACQLSGPLLSFACPVHEKQCHRLTERRLIESSTSSAPMSLPYSSILVKFGLKKGNASPSRPHTTIWTGVERGSVVKIASLSIPGSKS